jgi:hypothetical protein
MTKNKTRGGEMMLRFFCLWLCFSFVVGCSDGGLEGLYQVRGRVLLDGEPIEGASVFFNPIQTTPKSRAAVGLTDKNGYFRLTTLKTNDGIYPGRYQIYCTKSELVPEAAMLTEAERKKKYTNNNGIYSPPYQQAIPEKYINPTTSGFTYTVKKGKNKQITLKLDSKATTKKLSTKKI